MADDDDNKGKRPRRRLKGLASSIKGVNAAQQAMKDIGGMGVFDDAARATSSLRLVQDQMDAITGRGVFADQLRAQQAAIDALALPDTQAHLSALTGAAGIMDGFRAEQDAMEEARKLALGGLPEGYMDQLTGGAGEVSRMMEDLRENHRLMFQHVDMFADMRRSIEAVTPFDLGSALNIPRMDAFNDAFGIDRIGSALAGADAASVLGMQTFINDHFSALTGAQEAASAVLGLGAFDRLNEILAQGLATQEALEKEALENRDDDQRLAKINLRLVYIGLLLQIIAMAITVYFALEAGSDDEEMLTALRENTTATSAQTAAIEGQTRATEAQTAVFADIQKSLSTMAEQLSEQPDADADTADLTRDAAFIFGNLVQGRVTAADYPIAVESEGTQP